MKQNTEIADKCSKSRSDEECINFRPSPNFKHMKKYQKYKLEEAANQNATNGSNSETEMSSGQMEPGQQTSKAIQPPLPPNPPPDDLPDIVLKKEIDDDDYPCDKTDYNADVTHPGLITEHKTDKSEVSDKPQETMCRNFIRGTCTKGAACIYVHRLILSQLPGVYRFCRNFQNKGCKMPIGTICKFVHATVFEKETFFRTGYLPPHTMSHLKDSSVVQQPPPLPPPEKTQPVVPPVFTNPPPPVVYPGVTPAPVIAALPNGNIVPRTDVFRAALTDNTSPLKREWSDTDFSGSSRDHDFSEPLATKCKKCENNEFSVQLNKDKLKTMMRKNKDINKEIEIINLKNKKLHSVLLSLVKQKSSNGITRFTSDKKKAIEEQINLYLFTWRLR